MLSNNSISYDEISIDRLIFELQESAWDPSVIRMSYKLTRTTKIEKFRTFWKMYITTLRLLVINDCIEYVHSILN